ncbi:putative metal-dependent hydrolase YfiT [compost metagenome]|uniref:YfiT family bacillithiol transferase n=1 Tax=Paenibacillus rhizolycopersici TaxID=2780073 RepID=UPI000FA1A9D5
MDPRYPIGKFAFEGEITAAQREQWIREIESLPARLRQAVAGLSEDQLNLPYREGGWTLRQVVHHLADSHINAYTRFKLALTEETPTIRPYFEDRWATLADYEGEIEVSLLLLEALHRRWTNLLKSLGDADYERKFHHPESGETTRLAYTLGNYAWHGNHHLAHITALRTKLDL